MSKIQVSLELQSEEKHDGVGGAIDGYKVVTQLHGRDAHASATESARSQRGESPLQAYALRPVTESNCVAARRGGEQLEVKRPVRTIRNLFRPGIPDEPAGRGRNLTRGNGKLSR